MQPQVCTLVRDALESKRRCPCPNPHLPVCEGVPTTPPECSVFQLATHRDLQFNWQHDPAGLSSAPARVVRQKKLAAIEIDIGRNVAALEAKYGTTPTARAAIGNVTWWRMQRCLNKPDGSPGGNFGHKYVGRLDMEAAGYQPYPLFGGRLLEAGRVPAALVQALPVLMDRALNPGLMAVAVMLLLAVILAGLLLASGRRSAISPEELRKTNQNLPTGT